MIHLKMFRKCILFPESKNSHFGRECDVCFIWCRKPGTQEKPPSPIQKYFSVANFWLHHQSPKTSSIISANLEEG